MKVALIIPDGMWHYSQFTDWHFITDPSEEAIEFYRKETRYKIIDNGVYETGCTLSVDDYMTLINNVHADEVILPDAMFNMHRTLQLMDEFAMSVDKGPRKYIGVPQGRNPQEFIQCWRKIATLDYIDIVALPILCT